LKTKIETYESISVAEDKRAIDGKCQCRHDCGGDCVDYTKEIEVLKEFLAELETLDRLEGEQKISLSVVKKYTDSGMLYYDKNIDVLNISRTEIIGIFEVTKGEFFEELKKDIPKLLNELKKGMV
jgi:hypothetical protein